MRCPAWQAPCWRRRARAAEAASLRSGLGARRSAADRQQRRWCRQMTYAHSAKESRMVPNRFRSFFVGLAAALAAASIAHSAAAQSEQQKLVTDADKVFSNFERDPQMTWFQ